MKPEGLSLANWREPPYQQYSFRHIDGILPVARIGANASEAFSRGDLSPDSYRGADALKRLCQQTYGDALLVAQDGQIVFEWCREGVSLDDAHIVFSVSKSITGMLTGIIVDEGRLDPGQGIVDHLPGVAGSAYEDATVRNLLDMTIATEFREEYLGEDGDYARYRRSTGWNPRAVSEEDHMESFLYGLPASADPHGERFLYRSPNSDLLGLVCATAAGESIQSLLTSRLFKPLGCRGPAMITVDGRGAARTAGGICCTTEDLLRLGELMRCNGKWQGQQLIPTDWVEQCASGGNPEAWKRGDMAYFLPNGCYRNQWYQDDGAFFAIGIHGQWLYVDRAAGLTVAKVSAYPMPVSDEMDLDTLNAFHGLR